MLSHLHIILVILLLAALVVVLYYRNKVVAQRKHLDKILDDLNRLQDQNREVREFKQTLKARGRKYYNFVSEGLGFIAQHTDDEETLEQMKEDIKRDEELFQAEE